MPNGRRRGFLCEQDCVCNLKIRVYRAVILCRSAISLGTQNACRYLTPPA